MDRRRPDRQVSRVQVGDDLEFLGVVHRIVRVEPYTHPAFPEEQWWIAYDAYGWSITVTA